MKWPAAAQSSFVQQVERAALLRTKLRKPVENVEPVHVYSSTDGTQTIRVERPKVFRIRKHVCERPPDVVFELAECLACLFETLPNPGSKFVG